MFHRSFKYSMLAATLTSVMALGAHATTLNLHNGGDVTSLDPHKVSGDWENRPVGDMFEGLLTEAADGSAIAGQAESWEISEDGKTYTFTLRDGIQWTDGTPVTAGDFVYALQRLMNPETAADYAYLQYPIKNAEKINGGEITDLAMLGVTAPDDKTVVIELENPTPYFLSALTHYTAYPLPRHLVEKMGSDWVKLDNIAVNGSYFPTEWVPGSHIKAVRNDGHYDALNAKIDEVVYAVLEDNAAALKAYRAGEFDILTSLPKDQIGWLNENHPGEAKIEPFAGLYYYVINNAKFSDIRVREALSMAVNREVIGSKVLGTGEIPAYSWVPPGMDNYTETPYEVSWKDLPYGEKVAKAKQLLADAGYGTDNPLTLQLKYNTSDNHKRVAVAIAAMWKPLGVKVELHNSEVKVHYGELKDGVLDIARAGWLADYNDPENFLGLLKCGVQYNYGRYCSAEFDALMDQAQVTVDLKERAQLMYQAEKIAMDSYAAMPIYYYLSENVVSPKIQGFEDNAFDIHRTRWLTKTE